MDILDSVNLPQDLKKLNKAEKEKLAEELRKLVIDTVSKTGGHLASNLGAVSYTHLEFQKREFTIMEKMITGG